MIKQFCRNNLILDKTRGCMIGGAVGDALGYAVEFLGENSIYERYGDKGITEYELDKETKKALISDDTQMALFTANGLLVGDTQNAMQGIQGIPRSYVAKSYQDWLYTQENAFEDPEKRKYRGFSWLNDVLELYNYRAPGGTCLFALHEQHDGHYNTVDYVKDPPNDSKGSGGIMRVAPIALNYKDLPIETLDMEGAEIAAITHGHPLGYMPAAILTHIINRIVFSEESAKLKEIVLEAKETAALMFGNDKFSKVLSDIIDFAIELSENDESDLSNIHKIGEGWVAEETLGIAIYCALRYQHDFSAGIIASVNHRGDSDTTGAVTGNILGALFGFEAIDEKWKSDLELKDVIIEMADDLYHNCQIGAIGNYRDPEWRRKYAHMRWKGIFQKCND